VSQEIALVLDFLDLVRLVPRSGDLVRASIEEPRADFQLVGERLEVRVELFFRVEGVGKAK